MALIALVSVVHAQKRISVTDTYQGQTVLEIAKKHAVQAVIETRSIYKPGMTETEFVNECLKAFPKQFQSLRDVYVPYARYLFSFHKKGLTDEQVSNLVTGKEYVDCANGILAWQEANPGIEPETTKWWRTAIHWAAVFLTWLDQILPK